MRNAIALAAAGLVAASTIAAAPADQQRPADPAHTLELELGESDSASGATAGIGPWNFAEDHYRCDGTPEAQCEVVLVKVTNPFEEENAKKGRERANLILDLDSTVPVGDFALQVWESDESGARGEKVGYADANPAPSEDYEQMTVVVTSTEDETEFWYRVEIIYWAAAADYTLNVAFEQ